MARKAKSKAGTQDTASARPPVYKYEIVIALLRREQGATLEEIADATGWKRESVHAMLHSLRKQGQTIARVTRYRIVGRC